jgi:hypothetical protein
MGAWSFIKGVLGSDNVLNKKDGHLANVGAWIGNLKYTDEEMAEMDAKVADGVRKFAVDTLSENTERSKARRDIANLVIKFYFLLVFMSVIVYPFNKDWAEFIFLVFSGAAIGGAFVSVIIFFFGSHWHRTAKATK